MKLTLPEPPSSNRYWRNWRGRMVKSAEGRAYCALVATLCDAPPQRCKGGRSDDRGGPLLLPLAVSIRWFRRARRGDLDNRAKVVLDALQGIAYANDSQIVELHMFRHDDRDNPRVEVTVEAA